MTKQQYMEFHEECCRRMVEITKRKNADYTGTGDDPFANFSRVEHMGICSVQQGFLVRMADKLSRLSSFAQRGEFLVTDESFEDTCLDLANYAILLAGYMKQQRMQGEQGPSRGFRLDSGPIDTVCIDPKLSRVSTSYLKPHDDIGAMAAKPVSPGPKFVSGTMPDCHTPGGHSFKTLDNPRYSQCYYCGLQIRNMNV